MIRLAILGFWHVHAADYARQAQQHPDTEIVAAWDEDPDRGRTRSADLGVPFRDDLAELLAKADIDGVIVTTPTNAHRTVLVAAAEAGKHIFTEKVLALTPAECRVVIGAVERAAVRLTVSLPRLAHGYTRAIRDVLAHGRLGDVTLARTRLSHDGALGESWLPAPFFDPEPTGGGALIDLGCHPMYLARLFLGQMPADVSATFGHLTDRAVEDNAVAVLRCANGSLGVVEAGFVTRGSPFSIEVHGTEASLFYGVPDRRLRLQTAGGGGRDAWSEIPIPDDGPSPFDQWVGHIQDGSAATENVALALDLTTLMDAATRSAASGRTVSIG